MEFLSGVQISFRLDGIDSILSALNPRLSNQSAVCVVKIKILLISMLFALLIRYSIILGPIPMWEQVSSTATEAISACVRS